MLTKNTMMLLAALFLLLIVSLIIFRRQENFSFGDILDKIKDVGGKVVDVGKGIGDKVVDITQQFTDKIGDMLPGGGGGSKVEVKGKIFDKDFKPIYVYREKAPNGVWTCPKGTVDYGTNDDKQCLASEIGPRIFRDLADGTGNWGMKCPEGAVPNPGTDLPDQQCVRGWTQRRWIDGAWRCYSTDIDTGISWENSEWWASWRQCKKGEYPSVTTRMWDGKGWSCPPGSTDTGLDWKDGPADGFKQCKINPGG